ncbi:hypothetical protein P4H56_28470 [Bacillus cereus]|uniref:hypothetical protein n=1 Tax=Bacillus cereus group sp. BfR-BA-01312 TaxID=2920289 RepID=UPI001F56F816|nr:hypothetical protein [Bacillus cereus group sp. BfR-BA-01312]MEB8829868.1 hypothetical protein [Bacillus cereus]MED1837586.1 hypothetical protein [Bacillus thuringiensis]MED2208164.1 hypothetical protein [Bacillus thuringiensis]MED2698636.1 hypothetical protein [Bacillus thuringiensis]
MKIKQRDLKKYFKSLQILNDSFADFTTELGKKYPLTDDEKKKMESMREYFESTKSLFVNMESKCS